jgi:hypothetical protein
MQQWYWEGKIQSVIARALLLEGWSLLSEADTASKAHRIDLLLENDGRRLAIEVKKAIPLPGMPIRSARTNRKRVIEIGQPLVVLKSRCANRFLDAPPVSIA